MIKSVGFKNIDESITSSDEIVVFLDLSQNHEISAIFCFSAFERLSKDSGKKYRNESI